MATDPNAAEDRTRLGHQAELSEDDRHLSVEPGTAGSPGAWASTVDSSRQRPKRTALGVEDYVQGVASGDRAVLARAITLMESARPSDRQTARAVLTQLMPRTGKAMRIGITGVPGVGKSTFIDRFGMDRLAEGAKLAVLAVDPSSSVTGGSILGDKTRMAKLGREPGAFVRPSPAGRTLGGVARATREAMLLCEAAGFDLVLVETVGIGQSETVVSEMTDVFLALMLPGAGDELQGIKRGLIELADVLAVNKADGEAKPAAERAAAEYRGALRCMQPRHPDWATPVLTCSAATGDGLDKLWARLSAYHGLLTQTGELEARRQQQSLRWVWAQVEDRLREALRRDAQVSAMAPDIEKQVAQGDLPATVAADQIVDAFLRARPEVQTP
ncbi:MAG: methylmalonyl Co-A mutase-associated GTPase MeaB [Planctomycetota bacterium]